VAMAMTTTAMTMMTTKRMSLSGRAMAMVDGSYGRTGKH
jgi:hypothetical protein